MDYNPTQTIDISWYIISLISPINHSSDRSPSIFPLLSSIPGGPLGQFLLLRSGAARRDVAALRGWCWLGALKKSRRQKVPVSGWWILAVFKSLVGWWLVRRIKNIRMDKLMSSSWITMNSQYSHFSTQYFHWDFIGFSVRTEVFLWHKRCHQAWRIRHIFTESFWFSDLANRILLCSLIWHIEGYLPWMETSLFGNLVHVRWGHIYWRFAYRKARIQQHFC